MSRSMWATVVLLAAAGCSRRHDHGTSYAAVAGAARDASVASGAGDASMAAAQSASAAETSTSPISPSSSPGAPPTPSASDADGGVQACKILNGPTAQPFVGPAVLRVVPNGGAEVAELIYNEGGSPRVFTNEALRGPRPEKSTIPPCAATGDVVYCPDAAGVIRRSGRGGENALTIARGRSGTEIVAAALAGHALVAYLAERITSEGLVREAWVALENEPPVRISEDGSGATALDLATRGEQLIALTVDARVAMTPTHARVLTFEESKLRMGSDAVVFVGGGAERHTAGALTTAKDGSTFALVAVSEDALRFGLAVVKIDDPPVVDAKVVWSFYPNGIDPAPIAATRGEAVSHVARVRPKTTEADAPHVLEIGMVDSSGVFRGSCIAATASFVKDVELARDSQGMLWVFYRTPGGSYVARVRG